MDPPETPFARVGRTFWSVWTYITEAVDRYFRAGPTPVGQEIPNSRQKESTTVKENEENYVDNEGCEEDKSNQNESQLIVEASMVSSRVPGPQSTVPWESCEVVRTADTDRQANAYVVLYSRAEKKEVSSYDEKDGGHEQKHKTESPPKEKNEKEEEISVFVEPIDLRIEKRGEGAGQRVRGDLNEVNESGQRLDGKGADDDNKATDKIIMRECPESEGEKDKPGSHQQEVDPVDSEADRCDYGETKVVIRVPQEKVLDSVNEDLLSEKNIEQTDREQDDNEKETETEVKDEDVVTEVKNLIQTEISPSEAPQNKEHAVCEKETNILGIEKEDIIMNENEVRMVSEEHLWSMVQETEIMQTEEDTANEEEAQDKEQQFDELESTETFIKHEGDKQGTEFKSDENLCGKTKSGVELHSEFTNVIKSGSLTESKEAHSEMSVVTDETDAELAKMTTEPGLFEKFMGANSEVSSKIETESEELQVESVRTEISEGLEESLEKRMTGITGDIFEDEHGVSAETTQSERRPLEQPQKTDSEWVEERPETETLHAEEINEKERRLTDGVLLVESLSMNETETVETESTLMKDTLESVPEAQEETQNTGTGKSFETEVITSDEAVVNTCDLFEQTQCTMTSDAESQIWPAETEKHALSETLDTKSRFSEGILAVVSPDVLKISTEMETELPDQIMGSEYETLSETYTFSAGQDEEEAKLLTEMMDESSSQETSVTEALSKGMDTEIELMGQASVSEIEIVNKMSESKKSSEIKEVETELSDETMETFSNTKCEETGLLETELDHFTPQEETSVTNSELLEARVASSTKKNIEEPQAEISLQKDNVEMFEAQSESSDMHQMAITELLCAPDKSEKESMQTENKSSAETDVRSLIFSLEEDPTLGDEIAEPEAWSDRPIQHTETASPEIMVKSEDALLKLKSGLPEVPSITETFGETLEKMVEIHRQSGEDSVLPEQEELLEVNMNGGDESRIQVADIKSDEQSVREIAEDESSACKDSTQREMESVETEMKTETTSSDEIIDSEMGKAEITGDFGMFKEIETVALHIEGVTERILEEESTEGNPMFSEESEKKETELSAEIMEPESDLVREPEPTAPTETSQKVQENVERETHLLQEDLQNESESQCTQVSEDTELRNEPEKTEDTKTEGDKRSGISQKDSAEECILNQSIQTTNTRLDEQPEGEVGEDGCASLKDLTQSYTESMEPEMETESTSSDEIIDNEMNKVEIKGDFGIFRELETVSLHIEGGTERILEEESTEWNPMFSEESVKKETELSAEIMEPESDLVREPEPTAPTETSQKVQENVERETHLLQEDLQNESESQCTQVSEDTELRNEPEKTEDTKTEGDIRSDISQNNSAEECILNQSIQTTNTRLDEQPEGEVGEDGCASLKDLTQSYTESMEPEMETETTSSDEIIDNEINKVEIKGDFGIFRELETVAFHIEGGTERILEEESTEGNPVFSEESVKKETELSAEIMEMESDLVREPEPMEVVETSQKVQENVERETHLLQEDLQNESELQVKGAPKDAESSKLGEESEKTEDVKTEGDVRVDDSQKDNAVVSVLEFDVATRGGQEDQQINSGEKVESHENPKVHGNTAIKRRFEDIQVHDVKGEKAGTETDYMQWIETSPLDFTVQKSRISVKNPLIRRPKNPRSLLNMASAVPLSASQPSECTTGNRQQGVGITKAGPGVIGFKLPGLGAGLPVLRKTDAGRRVRGEDSAESPGSQEQKSETEERSGDSDQKEQAPKKAKWTPPRHPGMGNPMMMSELKSKLKKTTKE